jgi:hypothetical protein
MKKAWFAVLGLVFAVSTSSLLETLDALALSSVQTQVVTKQGEKWPPIWPVIDPDDGGVN